MSAKVVLIGPMASGKTKIGKRVARILHTQRLDSDSMFVADHGPIADFFKSQGESAFRHLEAQYVSNAVGSDAVVSLGGGAVLDEGTQQLLRSVPVISFHVSPEAVEARLVDGKRPLVTSGVQSWIDIYEKRRPIYDCLAHRTYDTSRGNLDEIAEDIAEWILSDYTSRQKVFS